MGSGQMMMTILAMVLLSVVILTMNRGFYNTNTTMAASRYNILAISVANSIIEDATSLHFDNATATGALANTTGLTAAASLGVETGESASNPKAFNDFDDYNVYSTNPKLDTILVTGTTKKIIFNSICKVEYVSASSPNTSTTTKTWHKRLSLRVYCPELRDPKTLVTDTIKISTVYSYWYFR
jgi:hypothetical protein